MKEFDVLVVGELNVDIILDDIQGSAEIGKEILAKTLNITLGSSSAIFASNLSTLGSSVAFIGKTGDDHHAQLIKKSLESKNVHTDFILSSGEHQTGLTVVLNYDMDRANVTFPGAMEALLENEISDEVLSSARHLHLSSVFLQTGLQKGLCKLFQRAKNLGLTTSMDPQWDPSERWDLDLDKLLPHVDIFLPNAGEFKHLTKTADLASGFQKVKEFAKVVVVKDGVKGAHAWDSLEFYTKPAFLNTDVADCIGAGDSFDAGFIHEYLKGGTIERCLEVGNVMGAINTVAHGGTNAFKNLATIKELARSRFSYTI